MLDAKLMPMINSDDPSYFGGYINENYIELAKSMQLTRTELIQLAKNAFQAAFISEDLRTHYLNELNTYTESFS